MALISKKIGSFFPSSRKLERAICDLEEGREKEAFSVFAALADKGMIDAQYYVGRCYLRGQGVPPSLEEGARWLYRAASQEQPAACFSLATLYLSGLPEGFDPAVAAPLNFLQEKKNTEKAIKIDYEKALEWARIGAHKGHLEAQSLLGWIMTYGPEEFRDITQARRWYERSANEGSAQGYYGYAQIIFNEAQNDEDYAKAARLFQKAAENGVAIAYTTLGWMYEKGRGVKPDIEQAGFCYKKAAEEGIGPAQAHYGLMLLKGVGVKQNIIQAETWLRRAAHNNVADAAAMLGDLYVAGDVFLHNLTEGLKWYEVAANLGHAAAARALAVMYYCGSGTWRDFEKAAYWFNCAAERGDPYANSDLGNLILGGGTKEEHYKEDLLTRLKEKAEAGDQLAAFNLGVCSANGLGCEKDEKKALHWFGKALSGVVNAQYWYGRLILEAEGRLGDPLEGFEWIEKAAEAGMGEACVVLAQILVTGQLGIWPDHQRALDLYKVAASQGNIDALFSLGALYGGGHDVEEDLQKAQDYFEQAANAGHALAQMMMGNYLISGRAGRLDEEEGKKWLKRAAEQGVEQATHLLASL